MLKQTFQHIRGFGSIKEVEFWKNGVLSWEDYLRVNSLQLDIFSEIPFQLFNLSFEALERRDADFFAQTLTPSEFYRIALTFPEDVMFLDIETTGLSRYYDQITLIGWSFLNEYNVYYKGLDTDKLEKAFKRARVVVTFNGSLFDLPFIRNEFPELQIPLCHIDLRFFAKRFGYSGGQKKIEEEIGFQRSFEAENVSGEIAPILWHKYKEGSVEALKKLIIYNKFDVDGMKALLDLCIENALKKLNYLKIDRSVKFTDFYSDAIFDSFQETNNVYIRPYGGLTGPRVTLKDLPTYKSLSIVGIDLTGSEKRPTGWCHLVYDKVTTRRINTDQELIDETLKCNPDLISIDSPLSLPFGRKTVFDDDEGRSEFGIMRECERILKRRGVNVYPSLIPSMQRLTMRGIQLATEFRKRGIPVIESYPGAAQDILGIPRKRASLEYLVKGLSSFGIKGEYETVEVSHDELDAITSAMLGYFFWCGKFEALGNENEDYLIIPDVEKDFPYWENKTVVGLSGGLSSGKTTGGEYLKSKGFAYGRFSMVIDTLIVADGDKPNRALQLKKGDYVNQVFGQRWLCKKLIEYFLVDKDQIVIDGLRFPEDHAFMREKFGPHFTHIHLHSTSSIRKERYNALERNNVPFEEATSHIVERGVEKLSALADVIVENNSDKEYFYKQLDIKI